MTADATNPGMPAIPPGVAARLGAGEQLMAALTGAQGSGMAVTDRRLIRWRPPGAIVSLPLVLVERVQLDPGRPDGRAMLLVVARDARPPLVLSLESRHMAAAGPFTTAVLHAVSEAVAATRQRPSAAGDGPEDRAATT